jgi:hypothetical protein
MILEQAYRLIKANIHIEKICKDNGEEISWVDMDSYKRNIDCSDINVNVYIKISKQYCPKHTSQCKARSYVWLKDYSVYNCILGTYKCLSKNSPMRENIPQYLNLKCTLHQIMKKDLYTKCDEMLFNLAMVCTKCLEKEWKDKSVEEFKVLYDIKQKQRNC